MNTIICHPEEEDTMIATQSTGWMEYILVQGQKKLDCAVADVFSKCGMSTCYTNHIEVPILV